MEPEIKNESMVIDLEKQVPKTLEELEDLVCEWNGNVISNFKMQMITGYENDINEQIGWYLNQLKTEVSEFKDTETMAFFMLKHIKYFANLYKQTHSIFADEFLNKMEDILVTYVNVVIRFRNKNRKSVKNSKYEKLIVQDCRKIKYLLMQCLSDQMGRIYHVLIKIDVDPTSQSCRDILSNIYEYFLLRQVQEISDTNFFRGYIIFQKWKQIEPPDQHEQMDNCMYTLYKKTPEELQTNDLFRKVLLPSIMVDSLNLAVDQSGTIEAIQKNYFKYYKTNVMSKEDKGFEAIGLDNLENEEIAYQSRKMDFGSDHKDYMKILKNKYSECFNNISMSKKSEEFETIRQKKIKRALLWRKKHIIDYEDEDNMVNTFIWERELSAACKENTMNSPEKERTYNGFEWQNDDNAKVNSGSDQEDYIGILKKKYLEYSNNNLISENSKEFETIRHENVRKNNNILPPMNYYPTTNRLKQRCSFLNSIDHYTTSKGFTNKVTISTDKFVKIDRNLDITKEISRNKIKTATVVCSDNELDSPSKTDLKTIQNDNVYDNKVILQSPKCLVNKYDSSTEVAAATKTTCNKKIDDETSHVLLPNEIMTVFPEITDFSPNTNNKDNSLNLLIPTSPSIETANTKANSNLTNCKSTDDNFSQQPQTSNSSVSYKEGFTTSQKNITYPKTLNKKKSDSPKSSVQTCLYSDAVSDESIASSRALENTSNKFITHRNTVPAETTTDFILNTNNKSTHAPHSGRINIIQNIKLPKFFNYITENNLIAEGTQGNMISKLTKDIICSDQMSDCHLDDNKLVDVDINLSSATSGVQNVVNSNIPMNNSTATSRCDQRRSFLNSEDCYTTSTDFLIYQPTPVFNSSNTLNVTKVCLDNELDNFSNTALGTINNGDVRDNTVILQSSKSLVPMYDSDTEDTPFIENTCDVNRDSESLGVVSLDGSAVSSGFSYNLPNYSFPKSTISSCLKFTDDATSSDFSIAIESPSIETSNSKNSSHLTDSNSSDKNLSPHSQSSNCSIFYKEGLTSSQHNFTYYTGLKKKKSDTPQSPVQKFEALLNSDVISDESVTFSNNTPKRGVTTIKFENFAENVSFCSNHKNLIIKDSSYPFISMMGHNDLETSTYHISKIDNSIQIEKDLGTNNTKNIGEKDKIFSSDSKGSKNFDNVFMKSNNSTNLESDSVLNEARPYSRSSKLITMDTIKHTDIYPINNRHNLVFPTDATENNTEYELIPKVTEDSIKLSKLKVNKISLDQLSDCNLEYRELVGNKSDTILAEKFTVGTNLSSSKYGVQNSLNSNNDMPLPMNNSTATNGCDQRRLFLNSKDCQKTSNDFSNHKSTSFLNSANTLAVKKLSLDNELDYFSKTALTTINNCNIRNDTVILQSTKSLVPMYDSDTEDTHIIENTCDSSKLTKSSCLNFNDNASSSDLSIANDNTSSKTNYRKTPNLTDSKLTDDNMSLHSQTSNSPVFYKKGFKSSQQNLTYPTGLNKKKSDTPQSSVQKFEAFLNSDVVLDKSVASPSASKNIPKMAITFKNFAENISFCSDHTDLRIKNAAYPVISMMGNIDLQTSSNHISKLDNSEPILENLSTNTTKSIGENKEISDSYGPRKVDRMLMKNNISSYLESVDKAVLNEAYPDSRCSNPLTTDTIKRTDVCSVNDKHNLVLPADTTENNTEYELIPKVTENSTKVSQLKDNKISSDQQSDFNLEYKESVESKGDINISAEKFTVCTNLCSSKYGVQNTIISNSDMPLPMNNSTATNGCDQRRLNLNSKDRQKTSNDFSNYKSTPFLNSANTLAVKKLSLDNELDYFSKTALTTINNCNIRNDTVILQSTKSLVPMYDSDTEDTHIIENTCDSSKSTKSSCLNFNDNASSSDLSIANDNTSSKTNYRKTPNITDSKLTDDNMTSHSQTSNSHVFYKEGFKSSQQNLTYPTGLNKKKSDTPQSSVQKFEAFLNSDVVLDKSVASPSASKNIPKTVITFKNFAENISFCSDHTDLRIKNAAYPVISMMGNIDLQTSSNHISKLDNSEPILENLSTNTTKNISENEEISDSNGPRKVDRMLMKNNISSYLESVDKAVLNKAYPDSRCSNPLTTDTIKRTDVCSVNDKHNLVLPADTTENNTEYELIPKVTENSTKVSQLKDNKISSDQQSDFNLEYKESVENKGDINISAEKFTVCTNLSSSKYGVQNTIISILNTSESQFVRKTGCKEHELLSSNKNMTDVDRKNPSSHDYKYKLSESDLNNKCCNNETLTISHTKTDNVVSDVELNINSLNDAKEGCSKTIVPIIPTSKVASSKHFFFSIDYLSISSANIGSVKETNTIEQAMPVYNITHTQNVDTEDMEAKNQIKSNRKCSRNDSVEIFSDINAIGNTKPLSNNNNKLNSDQLKTHSEHTIINILKSSRKSISDPSSSVKTKKEKRITDENVDELIQSKIGNLQDVNAKNDKQTFIENVQYGKNQDYNEQIFSCPLTIPNGKNISTNKDFQLTAKGHNEVKTGEPVNLIQKNSNNEILPLDLKLDLKQNAHLVKRRKSSDRNTSNLASLTIHCETDRKNSLTRNSDDLVSGKNISTNEDFQLTAKGHNEVKTGEPVNLIQKNSNNEILPLDLKLDLKQNANLVKRRKSSDRNTSNLASLTVHCETDRKNSLTRNSDDLVSGKNISTNEDFQLTAKGHNEVKTGEPVNLIQKNSNNEILPLDLKLDLKQNANLVKRRKSSDRNTSNLASLTVHCETDRKNSLTRNSDDLVSGKNISTNEDFQLTAKGHNEVKTGEPVNLIQKNSNNEILPLDLKLDLKQNANLVKRRKSSDRNTSNLASLTVHCETDRKNSLTRNSDDLVSGNNISKNIDFDLNAEGHTDFKIGEPVNLILKNSTDEMSPMEVKRASKPTENLLKRRKSSDYNESKFDTLNVQCKKRRRNSLKWNGDDLVSDNIMSSNKDFNLTDEKHNKVEACEPVDSMSENDTVEISPLEVERVLKQNKNLQKRRKSSDHNEYKFDNVKVQCKNRRKNLLMSNDKDLVSDTSVDEKCHITNHHQTKTSDAYGNFSQKNNISSQKVKHCMRFNKTVNYRDSDDLKINISTLKDDNTSLRRQSSQYMLKTNCQKNSSQKNTSSEKPHTAMTRRPYRPNKLEPFRKMLLHNRRNMLRIGYSSAHLSPTRDTDSPPRELSSPSIVKTGFNWDIDSPTRDQSPLPHPTMKVSINLEHIRSDVLQSLGSQCVTSESHSNKSNSKIQILPDDEKADRNIVSHMSPVMDSAPNLSNIVLTNISEDDLCKDYVGNFGVSSDLEFHSEIQSVCNTVTIDKKNTPKDIGGCVLQYPENSPNKSRKTKKKSQNDSKNEKLEAERSQYPDVESHCKKFKSIGKSAKINTISNEEINIGLIQNQDSKLHSENPVSTCDTAALNELSTSTETNVCKIQHEELQTKSVMVNQSDIKDVTTNNRFISYYIFDHDKKKKNVFQNDHGNEKLNAEMPSKDLNVKSANLVTLDVKSDFNEKVPTNEQVNTKMHFKNSHVKSATSLMLDVNSEDIKNIPSNNRLTCNHLSNADKHTNNLYQTDNANTKSATSLRLKDKSVDIKNVPTNNRFTCNYISNDGEEKKIFGSDNGNEKLIAEMHSHAKSTTSLMLNVKSVDIEKIPTNNRFTCKYMSNENKNTNNLYQNDNANEKLNAEMHSKDPNAKSATSLRLDDESGDIKKVTTNNSFSCNQMSNDDKSTKTLYQNDNANEKIHAEMHSKDLNAKSATSLRLDNELGDNKKVTTNNRFSCNQMSNDDKSTKTLYQNDNANEKLNAEMHLKDPNAKSATSLRLDDESGDNKKVTTNNSFSCNQMSNDDKSTKTLYQNDNANEKIHAEMHSKDSNAKSATSLRLDVELGDNKKVTTNNRFSCNQMSNDDKSTKTLYQNDNANEKLNAEMHSKDPNAKSATSLRLDDELGDNKKVTTNNRFSCNQMSNYDKSTKTLYQNDNANEKLHAEMHFKTGNIKNVSTNTRFTCNYILNYDKKTNNMCKNDNNTEKLNAEIHSKDLSAESTTPVTVDVESGDNKKLPTSTPFTCQYNLNCDNRKNNRNDNINKKLYDEKYSEDRNAKFVSLVTLDGKSGNVGKMAASNYITCDNNSIKQNSRINKNSETITKYPDVGSHSKSPESNYGSAAFNQKMHLNSVDVEKFTANENFTWNFKTISKYQPNMLKGEGKKIMVHRNSEMYKNPTLDRIENKTHNLEINTSSDVCLQPKEIYQSADKKTSISSQGIRNSNNCEDIQNSSINHSNVSQKILYMNKAFRRERKSLNTVITPLPPNIETQSQIKQNIEHEVVSNHSQHEQKICPPAENVNQNLLNQNSNLVHLNLPAQTIVNDAPECSEAVKNHYNNHQVLYYLGTPLFFQKKVFPFIETGVPPNLFPFNPTLLSLNYIQWHLNSILQKHLAMEMFNYFTTLNDGNVNVGSEPVVPVKRGRGRPRKQKK